MDNDGDWDWFEDEIGRELEREFEKALRRDGRRQCPQTPAEYVACVLATNDAIVADFMDWVRTHARLRTLRDKELGYDVTDPYERRAVVMLGGVLAKEGVSHPPTFIAYVEHRFARGENAAMLDDIRARFGAVTVSAKQDLLAAARAKLGDAFRGTSTLMCPCARKFAAKRAR